MLIACSDKYLRLISRKINVFPKINVILNVNGTTECKSNILEALYSSFKIQHTMSAAYTKSYRGFTPTLIG